jgi:hypothetical protein
MNFVEFAVDERLVSDAERVAFQAFAAMVAASSATERAEQAVAFADILGNAGEFRQYAIGSSGDRLARIDHLLKVFRENVELLVHKTWVEKTDEKRKEKLLEELLAFERDFRDGAVLASFRRFVALARSIAHLLFGHQSRAEDFLLYCFRIDPKLGLFFWYVGELETLLRDAASQELRSGDDLMTIETLVGIYVLSSF